ncbi:hypothetical protein F183_A29510 [Bryobacterales bacterium F-183]|nr:hypothetical protein F183_A29510 [Bryobacterales bacterium F-183]
MVLPATLFLLGAVTSLSPLVYFAIAATTALVLTLQPDAAQLTAYALATLTAFLASGVRRRLQALSLLILLAACLTSRGEYQIPSLPYRSSKASSKSPRRLPR